MTTKRTPNVFTVGGGPVAGALSGALRRAGVPVLGLWARRPEAARAAGAAAGVATYSAGPPDLLLEADVVILAVRDDALGEAAQLLVDSGFVTRRHVLIQCSGARPAAESFAGVAGRVGGLGTMHPLRAIVDPREAAAALRGTAFGVEGDAAGREVALALVGLLGGRPIDLAGGEMALYHAAAVMASNHLVALLDAAAELLGAAGIERREALAAVLPLARGALENLERDGVPRALTGPVSRGDVATVERHLAALRARAPGLLPLYRQAARRAVEIARAKGEAAPEHLARIQQALEAGD